MRKGGGVGGWKDTCREEKGRELKRRESGKGGTEISVFLLWRIMRGLSNLQ